MDKDAIWYRGKPQLPLKGAQPPVFSSCLLWPNAWMDEDTTWNGSRPRPRPHCVRRGPSCPRKGHNTPPLFGPCLLWPKTSTSATAELLLILRTLNCWYGSEGQCASCWRSVKPLLRWHFFDFSKWRLSAILILLCAFLGHPLCKSWLELMKLLR